MSPVKHRIWVSALHLPCFFLLFQAFILHPPCPQVIRSQSPLIFTLHHSPLHFSPLLISLPPLFSISTSSRCLMCRLTPLRLHDRVPTVSLKSFARSHTWQRGVMHARATVWRHTVIKPPVHNAPAGFALTLWLSKAYLINWISYTFNNTAHAQCQQADTLLACWHRFLFSDLIV